MAVPGFAIADRRGPVVSERSSHSAARLQPPCRFSQGEAVEAESDAPPGESPDDQPPDDHPQGRRLGWGRRRDGGQVRSRFSDEVEDLHPVVKRDEPKRRCSQAKSPALLGQPTHRHRGPSRIRRGNARDNPPWWTNASISTTSTSVGNESGLVGGVRPAGESPGRRELLVPARAPPFDGTGGELPPRTILAFSALSGIPTTVDWTSIRLLPVRKTSPARTDRPQTAPPAAKRIVFRCLRWGVASVRWLGNLVVAVSVHGPRVNLGCRRGVWARWFRYAEQPAMTGWPGRGHESGCFVGFRHRGRGT